MARPVDEKIVSLRLENADFEKNAKQSMTLFGKINSFFNKGLNIDGSKASKALQSIDQNAKKIDLGLLSKSAEVVTQRFSAMGIMAARVLENITDKVMATGQSIVKGLTLEPIMEGFGEYELKMGSIQTIMSNTGGKESMQSVNDALDELNKYADDTIYNFAEMTRNVGLFTTAGIGLRDSTDAIKGFSNLSASVGADATASARAMYQLSQGLQSGAMKLRDWMSIENAGMGGKLFQDALRQKAKDMGVYVNESIAFRETLETGWLTNDVMMATLRDFADDPVMLDAATKVKTFTALIGSAKEALGSGWATTWQLIIGDFEQARRRFTRLKDVMDAEFNASADKRNAYWEAAAKQGLGDEVFYLAEEVFKTIYSWKHAIGDVLSAVFPMPSARKIVANIREIRYFFERTRFKGFSEENKETFDALVKIVTAFKAMAQTVWHVVKEVVKGIGDLIPKGTGGFLLNILGKLAEYPIKLRDWVKTTGDIREGTYKLGVTLGEMGKKGYNAAKEAFDKGVISDWTQKVKEGFAKQFEGGITVAKVVETIKKGWENVNQSGGKAIEQLNKIKETALKLLRDDVFMDKLKDGVKKGAIAAAIIYVVKLMLPIMRFFSDLAKNINKVVGNFANLLEESGRAVKNFGKLAKAKALKEIALSILMLAAAIAVLGFLPSEQLMKGFITLGAVVLLLLAIMKQLDTLTISPGTWATIAALGVFFGMLVGSMLIFAILPKSLLSKAVGAVAALMVILGALLVGLKLVPGDLGVTGKQILAIAASIAILSLSMVVIAAIEPSQFIRSAAAIGGLMVGLTLMVKAMSKLKVSPQTVAAIIAASASIYVMSMSMETLANLKFGSFVQGAAGLALMIGGLIVLMTAMTRLDVPKLLMSAVALYGTVKALEKVSDVVVTLGSLPFSGMMQGILGVVLVLGALVAAMSAVDSKMKGAVSLGVALHALKLMVEPLEALSKIPFWDLAKGVGAIGATLAILVLAANLLNPAAVPALLALTGVLVGLGAVSYLIAKAFEVFAEALGKLADLAGPSMERVILAISQFLNALGGFVTQLAIAAVLFITTLATTLAENSGPVIESLFTIISTAIEELDKKLPEFIDLGVSIIMSILEGLEDNADTLINQAMETMVAMINGMANAIWENREGAVDALKNLGSALIVLLLEIIDQLIASVGLGSPGFAKKYEEWVKGAEGEVKKMDLSTPTHAENRRTVKTIEDDKKGIVDTVKGVATGATKSMGDNLKLDDKMSENLDKMLQGMDSKKGAVRTKGSEIAQQAKGGVGSISLYDSGASLVQGFANGITNNIWRARSAGTNTASAAQRAVRDNLSIQSPSKVLFGFGVNFVLGFINGIESNLAKVPKTAKDLAVKAIDALADIAKDATDSAFDLHPTIKPVLDMSDIRSANVGSGGIGARADLSGLSEVSTGFKIATNGLAKRGTESSRQEIQNNYNMEVNNEGLMDGATIVVREEADIERIARELDRRTSESFSRKGIKVVPA